MSVNFGESIKIGGLHLWDNLCKWHHLVTLSLSSSQNLDNYAFIFGSGVPYNEPVGVLVCK